MKRIFLFTISFALVLLCGSCSKPAPQQYKNVVNWYNSQTGEYIGGEQYIYKSTYNGHDYLKFGYYDRSSVVHDPDCQKCKQLK